MLEAGASPDLEGEEKSIMMIPMTATIMTTVANRC